MNTSITIKLAGLVAVAAITGSLAAWARAFKQRIDPHAQQEIRDLAIQWGEIIEPLYPVSWTALQK